MEKIEFALWLENQRIARGWSLNEASSQFGVSRQTLHQWRNAQSLPSLEAFLRIITVLTGEEYTMLSLLFDTQKKELKEVRIPSAQKPKTRITNV